MSKVERSETLMENIDDWYVLFNAFINPNNFHSLRIELSNSLYDNVKCLAKDYDWDFEDFASSATKWLFEGKRNGSRISFYNLLCTASIRLLHS